MPLRTIQPGAASVRLQHSNSGIRPSNLSIGQDQMPAAANPLHSDYSSWLLQPSSLDNEFFNINGGNHKSLDNQSSYRQHNLPTRAGTELRLNTQGSSVTYDRAGLESQEDQRIQNAVMILQ